MTCPDCDIYQRKLIAAQNRISDDRKSAELQLGSYILLQQQIVLTIRAYRWIAVGTAALFFCIGRWTA